MVWNLRNQIIRVTHVGLGHFHCIAGVVCKAPAKRSQLANTTYCNIVKRTTFGHPVAICWVLLAQVWKWSNLSQQHPTRCGDLSQHGDQTHATCCAQQCCDMLRWHVAIVWPGLKGWSMESVSHLSAWTRSLECGSVYPRFCERGLASNPRSVPACVY